MARLDIYVEYKRFLSLRLGSTGVRGGRSADCDIQLPSESVSRHHVTISPDRDGGFTIQDVSTNGTRVNSEMVHDRKDLAPGDRIYIDTYILVFEADDATPRPLETERTAVVHQSQLM
jgi:pSer/pThr/pTyr-binding forkhead associated (FHA) protein